MQNFEFPATLDLEAWISEPVLEVLNGGGSTAQQIGKNRVSIFDDFFRPEVISAMQNYVETQTKLQEKEVNFGPSKDARLSWGAFDHPTTLRFLYGAPFRKLLQNIAGRAVKRAPSYIPQINSFHPNSKGYYIHNDANEIKDFVMVINLNQHYRLEWGGRLQFYQINKDAILPLSTIEPTFNRVVFFDVHRDAWHGIEDMNGSWRRTNIILDWVNDVNH